MAPSGPRTRGLSFASIASSDNSLGGILEKAYSAGARSSIDVDVDHSGGEPEPVSPATSASFSFSSADTQKNGDPRAGSTNSNSVQVRPSIDTSNISVTSRGDGRQLRLVDAESPVDVPSSGGFWSPPQSAKSDRRRPSISVTSRDRDSQTSFSSIKFDDTDHGALDNTMGSKWGEESANGEIASILRDSWGIPIGPASIAHTGDTFGADSDTDEDNGHARAGRGSVAGHLTRAKSQVSRGLARLASSSGNLSDKTGYMLSHGASALAHHTISHIQPRLMSPGIQPTRRAKHDRSDIDIAEPASAALIASVSSAPLPTRSATTSVTPTQIDGQGDIDGYSFRGNFTSARSQTLPVEYEMPRSANLSEDDDTNRRGKLKQWFSRTASKMSSASPFHRKKDRTKQGTQSVFNSSKGPPVSVSSCHDQVYPAKGTDTSSRHDSLHDRLCSFEVDPSSLPNSAHVPRSTHSETKVSNYISRRDDTPWLSGGNYPRGTRYVNKAYSQSNDSVDSAISSIRPSSDSDGSIISIPRGTSDAPAYEFIHGELIEGEKKRKRRLRSLGRKFVEQASAIKSYLSTGGGKYGNKDDDDQSGRSVIASDWNYSPSRVALV
ncbi:hypothetical protein I317_00304 [Kwoniella heveanensis CBS 569]|nr:hypothetical protein I317_00304 [Kwoniella heveanensis CBS 569]